MKRAIKIGFCYDLRDDYLKMGYSEDETAEFDRLGTIEAIESELVKMGFEVERIGNIMSLTEVLVKGYRWDIVFNICEGMFGTGREAQVPALLDAYETPYVFSGPLVMAVTLDKSLAKIMVKDAGIDTPEHFVVYEPADIHRIDIPFPLFAKPLAEGTGKGIDGSSVIGDERRLRETCLSLLSRYNQPVLVEEYLSGREFTAGIVGTGKDARCVGVMEVVLKDNAEQGVYSYNNKEECEERVLYLPAPPEDTIRCEELALRAWNAVKCEDGGRVDIRYDSQGTPNFLEINALAGLHPDHSDLPILAKLNGISYSELMRMIMDSALQKLKILPLENGTSPKPVVAGEAGLSDPVVQPTKNSPVTVDRNINWKAGTL
jgi:D-alanine-D-alanine ligase